MGVFDERREGQGICLKGRFEYRSYLCTDHEDSAQQN